MSRGAQKKYGPGGKYYRKWIKRPDGKWEDVYNLTKTELREKVTVRQAQLAWRRAGDPRHRFVLILDTAPANGRQVRKSPHYCGVSL